MVTYFIAFEVYPTSKNEHFAIAKDAVFQCWVLGDDPLAASREAEFFAGKYDWKIVRVQVPPLVVTREQFVGNEIELKKYDNAQNDGIAFITIARPRDGVTTAGLVKQEPSTTLDPSEVFKKIKQLNNTGRCLHFESGKRCDQIIKAHSIQKNQSLSAICKDGHVYALSANMRLLNANGGQLGCEKIGINKVSTFLGFCNKHDNELFEPIDNHPLSPTDHQVMLYAYRSICREVFVSENALTNFEAQLKRIDEESVIAEQLSSLAAGKTKGLYDLKTHKELYEQSLKHNQFGDIRYMLFISKQKPSMALSGLFYPDFDFVGKMLQDLGNLTQKMELITICSAPTKEGWGFLIAWHQSSSYVCSEFIKSLEEVVYEGANLGDCLFRLSISCCENHAISPSWWEKLPEKYQEQIIKTASRQASLFHEIKNNYLAEGLESIAGWKFEIIHSNR